MATVWRRPFPVSAWQCPHAQSEVHTEMVCRNRCGKTLLACKSPDLNSNKHLWDELEHWLRARPNPPTSMPNLTNARGWMEASPCSNVPTSSGKPSQKSGGCYSRKVGTNSISMPMILEWDVWWAGIHIRPCSVVYSAVWNTVNVKAKSRFFILLGKSVKTNSYLQWRLTKRQKASCGDRGWDNLFLFI